MEKKTDILSIRIDEQLKKVLELYAAQDRRTVSQFVYLLIEKELLNRGAVLPVAFMPELQRGNN